MFVRCNPEKYMTYERIFNRLREDSQVVKFAQEQGYDVIEYK